MTSVALTLHVTFAPGGAKDSVFALHSVRLPWEEGKGSPATGSGNNGAPAQTGETTWSNRLSPNTRWEAPGGRAGFDYGSKTTASVPVSGVGSYTIASASNPELISDIQSWIDQPSSNFGWVLISQSEDILQTARRFGSPENPNSKSPPQPNQQPSTTLLSKQCGVLSHTRRIIPLAPIGRAWLGERTPTR